MRFGIHVSRMICLTALVLPGAAIAGTYDLTWYTIDGGGGVSAGGGFEIAGTIGQPDAGPMAGADYELVGGFWAGTISSTPPPCPGDLNGDLSVDLTDLSVLLAHYGETGATYEQGDLNGDGAVDLSDLATLLSYYGTNCF